MASNRRVGAMCRALSFGYQGDLRFPEYQIPGIPPLAACVAQAVACANAFIAWGAKLELFNNVSRLAELYHSQRQYAVARSFAKRLLEIAEKDRSRESATIVASPALARQR
jgi:hypothetical protein